MIPEDSIITVQDGVEAGSQATMLFRVDKQGEGVTLERKEEDISVV